MRISGARITILNKIMFCVFPEHPFAPSTGEFHARPLPVSFWLLILRLVKFLSSVKSTSVNITNS